MPVPTTCTPSPVLSAIVFPAPAVVPPIVLPEAPVSISTPVALAIATVPVTSVPM